MFDETQATKCASKVRQPFVQNKTSKQGMAYSPGVRWAGGGPSLELRSLDGVNGTGGPNGSLSLSLKSFRCSYPLWRKPRDATQGEGGGGGGGK